MKISLKKLRTNNVTEKVTKTENEDELNFSMSPFNAMVLVTFLSQLLPENNVDSYPLVNAAFQELSDQVNKKITKQQVVESKAQLKVNKFLKTIPKITT